MLCSLERKVIGKYHQRRLKNLNNFYQKCEEYKVSTRKNIKNQCCIDKARWKS